MNTQFALDACGLEELDGTAMMAVNGGLVDWPAIIAAGLLTLVTCVVKSTDSLIDGAQAGWNAY